MTGSRRRRVSPMVINRILAAINFRPRMTAGEIQKALELDVIQLELDLMLRHGYVSRVDHRGVNRYMMDERGTAYVQRCRNEGVRLDKCLRLEDRMRLVQGS